MMTRVLRPEPGERGARLVLTPAAWTDRRRAWTVLEETGTRLGTVALTETAPGVWRLGFAVAPAARGGGAVASAAGAAARFAVDELDARLLTWSAPVGAHAARLVAYRLGFVFEGTTRTGAAPRWHASAEPDRLRGPFDPPTDYPLALRRAATFAAPPPTLRLPGTGVHLRPFASGDAAAFADACDRPESAAWTSITLPYTAKRAQWFVERYAPQGWREGQRATLAVADDTGQCVGDVEIRLREDDLGTGDLGCLLHPRLHGRGLARTLVGALCDWAFAALGLRRIESQTFCGNAAARHMLERVGFQIEGTLRAHALLHEIPTDRWIGTLLAADRAARTEEGRCGAAATVRQVNSASSIEQERRSRA